MKTLTVGFHYSFSVYANSILGAAFKAVQLVSIMDYQSALRHENIVLYHRQIYPNLPVGTPSDPTKYTYYQFRNASGKTFVVADVWIIDSTIEQSAGVDQTIVMRNVTSTQVAIVRDQLRLLGISFDMT